MTAYYSDIDPFAAAWLRELIKAGHIAPGEVDERSIIDVRPDDLRGFTQCHFFAGIGGWSYAARLAGWPDDRELWTGSCPCQPFSLAGKQKGFDDARHLWPHFAELIRECDPPVVFGEQVASATDWLRLVRSDLEAMGRAVGAIPIEAASAGADHLRDRYWFVADTDEPNEGEGREQRGGELSGAGGDQETRLVVDLASIGRRKGRAEYELRSGRGASPDASGWVFGADGKARRVKPGIRLLAHGIPNRVAKLRAFGNAIDPRPAAQFIGAYLDIRRVRLMSRMDDDMGVFG